LTNGATFTVPESIVSGTNAPIEIISGTFTTTPTSTTGSALLSVAYNAPVQVLGSTGGAYFGVTGSTARYCYEVNGLYYVPAPAAFTISPVVTTTGTYTINAASNADYQKSCMVVIERCASSLDAWNLSLTSDPEGNESLSDLAVGMGLTAQRYVRDLPDLKIALKRAIHQFPPKPQVLYALDQCFALGLNAREVACGTGVGVIDDILEWLTVEVGEKVGAKAIKDGTAAIKRWIRG